MLADLVNGLEAVSRLSSAACLSPGVFVICLRARMIRLGASEGFNR